MRPCGGTARRGAYTGKWHPSMERCHFPSPVHHEGSIHGDFRYPHCACDAHIISRRNTWFSLQICGLCMHIRAQISAELRKLDTLWVRSKRADPQRLSDNNASVTLTSDHEGHAASQRNDTCARSEGGEAGVRQRRVGRSRTLRGCAHTLNTATRTHRGKAIAGRNLTASAHA